MNKNIERTCHFQLSNVTSTDEVVKQHCGKQLVNEIVLLAQEIPTDSSFTAEILAQTDPSLLDYQKNTPGVMLLYLSNRETDVLDLDPDQGAFISKGTISGSTYSIYRKENLDNITQWTPVAVKITDGALIDYNISNQRDYIYVAFPTSDTEDTEDITVYGNANEEGTAPGVLNTHWDEWSIAELIPAQLPLTAPNIKKHYVVDYNNVWLFKYDFQGGEQTQNIMFNERDTLGRYPRMSHGKKNNISSSVSCYLGSEIICVSKVVDTIIDNGQPRDIYGPASIQYTERPNIGRLVDPKKPLETQYQLTTNEAMDMLDAWRAFAYSKNLKLLTDKKGQTKIVQITSTSVSIADNIPGQPVRLSFNWTEVASTDGVLITGDVYDQE